MKFFASSQDPVDNGFTSFLLNYGYLLAIGAAVIIAIIVLVLVLLQRGKKAKPETKVEYSSNDIIIALGGKENILSHQKAGSRISLELKNYDVDETKLNELGVNSIIKMSNKIILVVKDDPDSFYKMFN